MKIRANVKKPLYQGCIFSHTTHVQHILPIVFFGQIDVVKKLWEGFEHPEILRRKQGEVI